MPADEETVEAIREAPRSSASRDPLILLQGLPMVSDDEADDSAGEEEGHEGEDTDKEDEEQDAVDWRELLGGPNTASSSSREASANAKEEYDDDPRKALGLENVPFAVIHEAAKLGVPLPYQGDEEEEEYNSLDAYADDILRIPLSQRPEGWRSKEAPVVMQKAPPLLTPEEEEKIFMLRAPRLSLSPRRLVRCEEEALEEAKSRGADFSGVLHSWAAVDSIEIATRVIDVGSGPAPKRRAAPRWFGAGGD